MIFFKIGRSVRLVLLASVLAACSVPSERPDSRTLNNLTCVGSSELIADPLFATINDNGSQWQYSQHAGKPSFKVDASEGTITFERIGAEPWAIFGQIITDERLGGAAVRYTADLRGDVSPDVTHFFGAKAGLFLQIGQHPDAYMGDQDPSVGQWDWQAFSVTKTLPEGVNVVKVGFIHQAGEGAIEARNPSLVLVNCPE